MRADQEKRAASTCSSGLREMLREGIAMKYVYLKKKKSVFRTFVLGEAEGALFIAHLYTLLPQDTVQA